MTPRQAGPGQPVRPLQLSGFSEGVQGPEQEGREAYEGDPGAEPHKEDVEEDAAGVRQPRGGRIPSAPTKKELEEHYPLHIPYREWCPVCRSAEGVHDHARKDPDPEDSRLGVTVSMDYCFLTHDAEGDLEAPKVLIMYDDCYDALWALQVERKGVLPEVVSWVLQKLEEAGYSGKHITLKSDQKENIMALKRAVMARRSAATTPVESRVRVSTTNAKVERAIRRWRGQFRKLKLHLEGEIGTKVEPNHAIVPWMVSWAGDIILKYRQKANGRTAYEDMTGHRVKHKVCGFGEWVQFQVARDPGDRNKFDGEWLEGYFVGVITRSSEYLVVMGDVVYKCPTIRRRMAADAYTAKCLVEVQANFFDYIRRGATTRRVETAPGTPRPGPQEAPHQPREYQPKRTYLMAEDFEEFGFTLGCPGCSWLQDPQGFRRAHSDECRERITELLKGTEEGRKRLGRTKDRVDNWIYQRTKDEAEESDTKRPGKESRQGEAPVGEQQTNSQGKHSTASSSKRTKKEEDEIRGISKRFRFGPATEEETGTIGRAIAVAVRPREPDRPASAAPAVGEDGPPPNQEAGANTQPDHAVLEEDVQKQEQREQSQSSGIVRPHDSEEGVPEAKRARMSSLSDWPGKGDEEFEAKCRSLLADVGVAEIFSPAKFIAVASGHGLRADWALDLKNGWDLSKKSVQQRVWQKIMEDKPQLIIGSPPCTWVALIQELSIHKHKNDEEWVAKFEEEKAQAEEHIKFCIRIYRHQLANGRHFLHEYPWTASSWGIDGMHQLCQDPRVMVVKRTKADGLVKKPTGFITSSWGVRDELDRQCLGDHVHTQLEGGRVCSAAAVHSVDLCHAICRGLAKQAATERMGLASTRPLDRRALYNLRAKDEIARPIGEYPERWADSVHEEDGGRDFAGGRPRMGVHLLREELQSIGVREGVCYAWDDVSGAPLDWEKVKAARREEMKFFEQMGAYTRCWENEVSEKGGTLIDLRWIDVNKGDTKNPNYRSRLVGREYNTYRDDSLYAATPPIEALRMIIGAAATTSGRGGRRRGLMVNDVSRAYFYAAATRPLYIKLPKEDEAALPGQVGRLNVCLYGTRDASKGWQTTLSNHLVELGFKRGKGFPAVFYHPTRDIKCLVHGDDYVSAGLDEELGWFEEQLKARYAIKTQRLRGNQGVGEEVKVLNRVVRRVEQGYELEGDPRHAELIIEQLLDKGARIVSTPGVDKKESDEDQQELPPAQASQYRALVARCNYMSFDRPDIQYAVKEACRDMASPNMGSWEKLVRIAQYLKGRPRLIWRYHWQAYNEYLDTFGDADWAGCRRTRKSTSGGAIKSGDHCYKTWSKTQSLVAKSSAESELYGIVKASCETLGAQTLLEDLGESRRARLHVDAKAAKSICEREGLERVRHIDVNVLWLQEQEVRQRLPLRKVLGTSNPADLMTKHLSQRDLDKCIGLLGLEFREGRAQAAAELHSACEKPVCGKRSVPQGERQLPDRWVCKGNGGMWTREHRTYRKALFEPSDVESGGPNPSHIFTIRRTEGVTSTGRRFVVTDDMSQGEQGSRPYLQYEWLGRTTFYSKASRKKHAKILEMHERNNGDWIMYECNGVREDCNAADAV